VNYPVKISPLFTIQALTPKFSETSLKMTSTAGIKAFTIFGVAGYLVVFLGLALLGKQKMDSQSILLGGILGIIFIAILIVSALRIGRLVMEKFAEQNKEK
jgi:Na+/melibiose symporter-like transporter